MANSGITQSPFDQAWPTPDVGGTGANGIGGGLDLGEGSNGIVASPFDKAVCPTPGGDAAPCADLGIPAPNFVQVDGGDTGSLSNDITQTMSRDVSRR